MERRTHAYFPDHVWPYLVLTIAVLATLGMLAFAGQSLLEPGQAADPRAGAIPRPEWYFLALFQFAKLGPGLWTTMLIPGGLVLGLVFWPLVETSFGPRLARRLGWRSWPVPKRNVITGTICVAGLAILTVLTLWAAYAPQLCLPWPWNGPVCGG